MIKQINTAGYACILAFLLAACTATEEYPADNNDAVLSPQIQVGGTGTRAVIGGTNPNPGGNEINQVQLFITRNEDCHTIYHPETNGLTTFTLSGDIWSSNPAVTLSGVMARIFAFYPPITTDVTTNFIPSTTDEKHKIKVSIPAEQTFDGKKDWKCSTTDYLYGSKESTVGDATAITANNAKEAGEGVKPFSPTISMQHALSYLVFTLQSTSGRDVDDTYDYVKEVRLSTTDNTNQFRISGTSSNSTMQINDGTLDLVQSPVLKFTATSGTPQLCGKSEYPQIVAYGLVAPLGTAPADLKLTVVLDKKESTTEEKRELSVTLSPKVWQKGNRYVFNLTLTERGITVDSTEITGWGDGWNGNESEGNGSLYPDGYKPASNA